MVGYRRGGAHACRNARPGRGRTAHRQAAAVAGQQVQPHGGPVKIWGSGRDASAVAWAACTSMTVPLTRRPAACRPLHTSRPALHMLLAGCLQRLRPPKLPTPVQCRLAAPAHPCPTHPPPPRCSLEQRKELRQRGGQLLHVLVVRQQLVDGAARPTALGGGDAEVEAVKQHNVLKGPQLNLGPQPSGLGPQLQGPLQDIVLFDRFDPCVPTATCATRVEGRRGAGRPGRGVAATTDAVPASRSRSRPAPCCATLLRRPAAQPHAVI